MKKIITLFLAILIIGVFAFYQSSYRINYNDGLIPGTTYKIKLSKIKKDLTVKVIKHCSEAGCEENQKENSIKLTNDEFEKTTKLIKSNDMGKVCSILDMLSKDGEAYLNDDSSSTYREVANQLIDDYLNNL